MCHLPGVTRAAFAELSPRQAARCLWPVLAGHDDPRQLLSALAETQPCPDANELGRRATLASVTALYAPEAAAWLQQLAGVHPQSQLVLEELVAARERYVGRTLDAILADLDRMVA